MQKTLERIEERQAKGEVEMKSQLGVLEQDISHLSGQVQDQGEALVSMKLR